MSSIDKLPTLASRFRGIWLAIAVLAIPVSLWATPQGGPDIDNPGQPPAATVEAGDSVDGASTTDEETADAEQPPAESENATESDEAGDGATDAKTPNDGAIWNAGALGLLLSGGPFMWPILIMGVLAVGVIIERYRSLRMVQNDSGAVRKQVLELLRDDRIEDALMLCEREEGPVPAVLSAGLRKYYVLRRLDYDPGAIEPQVVKAMDDYSVHIAAALEKNLAILATVSSAAPMLGFLGTVQGMIVAFKDIVDQMGETNIVAAAASGIQVSLLTTCFGLIVGIPAFIAFNYFTSVTNRYVLDVEESATDLVESVTLQMALDKRPV